MQRFPRHATLVSQGSADDHLFVVLDGRAKEHYLTCDGREVVLSLHGPGDIVWLGATVEVNVSITAVTALEPLDALVVHGHEARQVLAGDARLRDLVHSTIQRQLREAKLSLVEHSTCDATTRVAHRLLDLAERWGRHRGAVIELDMALTQEELGSWAGVSRETTVKALSGLRRDGVLQTSRRHVTIRDVEALRVAADDLLV